SATAINYAKGIASPGNASVNPITACDAEQFATVLVGASAASTTSLTISGRNYTIANPATTVATGETAECTIKDTAITGSTAQTFHIVGCAAGGACAS